MTGAAIETMVLKGKYTLEGHFVAGGLKTSNGNPNHLELTSPPQRSAPRGRARSRKKRQIARQSPACLRPVIIAMTRFSRWRTDSKITPMM